MCLAQALIDGHARKALRDYYVSGQLAEHLIHADRVRVVTLEALVRIANPGKL